MLSQTRPIPRSPDGDNNITDTQARCLVFLLHAFPVFEFSVSLKEVQISVNMLNDFISIYICICIFLFVFVIELVLVPGSDFNSRVACLEREAKRAINVLP